MTYNALAAGALTFFLIKSKQKSSTTALIDPLCFHYGKYLMNEQLGIKYFYPPFKQWSLNIVTEVGVLTAIRIHSLSRIETALRQCVSLFYWRARDSMNKE